MKTLLAFAFLAIGVPTVCADDLRLGWDIDWGWAGNFSDEYSIASEDLTLTIAADFGEYTMFATELELENLTDTPRYVGWNAFSIVTDLGGFLGLSGFDLTWENGHADLGAEAEYSDFGIVGYANSAADTAGLFQDLGTSLKLTSGPVWTSVASSWNLGLDSTDPAVVNADSQRQIQLYAGAVDPVPGLALEAGTRIDPDRDGITLAGDAAYRIQLDRISLSLGGSLAGTTLAAGDLIALNGLSAAIFKQLYGAGILVSRNLSHAKTLYSSLSFTGDNYEPVRKVGGGAGFEYRIFGAEAAVSYDLSASAGEGAFEGLDLSGFVDIDGVLFTLGYVVTDGYGWSNNSAAPLPSTGGVYFRLAADF